MVDSRGVDDGSSIRRRRECLGCGRRFTTYERIEESVLVVLKRNGVRQPFDRVKVVAGLRSAAKNLAISPEQIDNIAAEVEESIRLEGAEVHSQRIGIAVLERLRAVDGVAYLRFASVYKGFTDPGDFAREVKLLAKETDPKPSRPAGG